MKASEAPDKIYVNFPFGEEHPWRGPMVTKQGLNQYDTTYIRKDVLLEWAKGFTESKIFVSTLIDKLNSL